MHEKPLTLSHTRARPPLPLARPHIEARRSHCRRVVREQRARNMRALGGRAQVVRHSDFLGALGSLSYSMHQRNVRLPPAKNAF